MTARGRSTRLAAAFGIAACALVHCGVAAEPRPAVQISFTAGIAASDPVGPAAFRPLLDRYCAGCHNARVSSLATASGVVLENVDLSRVAERPDLWEKVIRKLRVGAMPPAGMPRPEAPALEAFIAFLETTLDRAAAARPDPGRRSPHRLNRAEYSNAIRDLLALEIDAAALLPPDDTADGFDNNADALGFSPVLLERYLSAAARISALAVANPAIGPSSQTYRVRGDASQTEQHDELPFGTRGGLVALHTFPLDGEYVIRAKLLETNLGSIRGLEYRHHLEITVDGERVLLAPIGGPEDYVQSSSNATDVVEALNKRLQVRVHVKAGQRPVAAAFLGKPASLGGGRLQPFDRSTLIATDHLGLPHVEYLTVSGPFNATPPADTPSRRRIFTCRPSRPADEAACARSIVAALARRAYRRPVGDADVQPLLAFYQQGRREGGFERGIELALRAILISPEFLVRVERDPAGVPPGVAHPVSDVELASRLSFFLWSSIPDDELLELAERSRLRRSEIVTRQVRRMLADRRAEALVHNFAAQWLHIRNLRSSTPDKNLFPNFDDNLRQAFRRELELFVGSVLTEDRSVLELLTADYTFVNERLARHYGIPNVYGPHFRRVTPIDNARRGLLGKGGVLLVTSHPDRTSPVVRGKWILDNLIGMPPPPPPPDVPQFPETAPGTPPTVRARMEQHRVNPACASCHSLMDPIGLALETFDAVGAWRTEEGGTPIDATGVLWDGTRVDGVAALRDALLARPDVFVFAFTEKLLTYALGRGLRPEDMPTIRGIVRAARRDGYRISSIVNGIVASVPFRMRIS